MHNFPFGDVCMFEPIIHIYHIQQVYDFSLQGYYIFYMEILLAYFFNYFAVICLKVEV